MMWSLPTSLLGSVVGLVGLLPGTFSLTALVSPTPSQVERWDQVKLAVAHDHVETMGAFWGSLRWWAGEPHPHLQSRIQIAGDALEPIARDDFTVIHIRGDLAAPLRVGDHSEVVIGGNVAKDGRIDAEGIAFIHVQGSVDGIIECDAMASVWVGGDLRGQVRTGAPSMRLRVGGDLLGSVRPQSKATLLAIDVSGSAASHTIRSIDAYNYTEFTISIARSDLPPGIQPLWSGRSGFVAVAATR